MAIHQMLVSAWVAHSGRRLAQRAQTADRAPEQKDGGKDQCERDQPKNQAVPYISLPGVRSVDGQGETKNGNTGATQQQENRRNNPEHRPRYSSGASHLALLADSRLPRRSIICSILPARAILISPTLNGSTRYRLVRMMPRK